MDIPTQCWVHPALEVRPSPTAGRGLFTSVPLPRGTAVARLGGRVVTGAALEQLFAQRAADPSLPYIDTIIVDADAHLILDPASPVRYGNHSCDPNTWWRDALTLETRRDVSPDEEVTNDYATSAGMAHFRMACRCGADSCRGMITGEDWQRADLQRLYGDHWAPALLARIRQATSGPGSRARS